MKNRIKARTIKKATAALTGLFTLTLLLTHAGFSLAGKGNPKAGKVMFEKNCIGCHGKKGEGLGEMSKLPNFTNPKVMMGRTDQDLFDKITNGGKGTGMPAWGPLLSEQDRWNLVAYIRTLSSSPLK
jgi:mono/diheme cytochrome c family protein